MYAKHIHHLIQEQTNSKKAKQKKNQQKKKIPKTSSSTERDIYVKRKAETRQEKRASASKCGSTCSLSNPKIFDNETDSHKLQCLGYSNRSNPTAQIPRSPTRRHRRNAAPPRLHVASKTTSPSSAKPSAANCAASPISWLHRLLPPPPQLIPSIPHHHRNRSRNRNRSSGSATI